MSSEEEEANQGGGQSLGPGEGEKAIYSDAIVGPPSAGTPGLAVLIAGVRNTFSQNSLVGTVLFWLGS